MQEPLDVAIDTTGVARLTLNRPKRANSLDADLTDALLAALARLSADQSVRLMVLSSAGRSFCAGIDLAWMKSAGEADADANLRDAMKLATLLKRLRMLPFPTFAVVPGPVIGFGVGLVAACDIALAVDIAEFRLTEVRLGIVPAVISPYLIDAIGERGCRRYFLSAEPFEAEEALRLGLLHEVCAPEALGEATARIVAELLAGKGGAQRAAKVLIERQRSPAIDDALIAETARLLATLRSTGEAQDALRKYNRA